MASLKQDLLKEQSGPARRLSRTVLKLRRRRSLLIESLESRHMLAADWQNPLLNLDVNDDGSVSPLDVLEVINDINLQGTRRLSVPFNEFSNAGRYIDPDGDGSVSPLDVLQLINSINAALPVPSIDLGLVADKGASSTDLLTNDPRVQGTARTNTSRIVSAKIRVNHAAVSVLPIDASGKFQWDPRLLTDLADGSTRVGVAVTLENGSTGLQHFNFSYDATAPFFVPPHLTTADDSGLSNTDNITNIVSPHLQVEAEEGSQLVLSFGSQELANVVSTGVLVTQLTSLADGLYDVTASATDRAGNVSQTGFPVTIKIDTVPPSAAQLDLATTSDTGTKGDRQTGAARVTLIGTTEGNAIVTLVGLGLSARSANDGAFRLPSVALTNGANEITAHVVDLAGNIGIDSQTTLNRITETSTTDPVVRWDNAALEAIRLDATTPVVATRNLAMMSLAIFDVVNAVERTPSLLVGMLPPPNVSP